jgi:hypothetical protein
LLGGASQFVPAEDPRVEKIQFTLDSGTTHTLSENVYGKEGPLRGKDASVQLSLITENLRYFTADDGTVIFTAHISSARIIRE